MRKPADRNVITRRPGFDWDARIMVLPGVPAHVHDAYVAGEGLLRRSRSRWLRCWPGYKHPCTLYHTLNSKQNASSPYISGSTSYFFNSNLAV